MVRHQPRPYKSRYNQNPNKNRDAGDEEKKFKKTPYARIDVEGARTENRTRRTWRPYRYNFAKSKDVERFYSEFDAGRVEPRWWHPGFCYLVLFPRADWVQVGNFFGPFPRAEQFETTRKGASHWRSYARCISGVLHLAPRGGLLLRETRLWVVEEYMEQHPKLRVGGSPENYLLWTEHMRKKGQDVDFDVDELSDEEEFVVPDNAPKKRAVPPPPTPPRRVPPPPPRRTAPSVETGDNKPPPPPRRAVPPPPPPRRTVPSVVAKDETETESADEQEEDDMESELPEVGGAEDCWRKAIEISPYGEEMLTRDYYQKHGDKPMRLDCFTSACANLLRKSRDALGTELYRRTHYYGRFSFNERLHLEEAKIGHTQPEGWKIIVCASEKCTGCKAPTLKKVQYKKKALEKFFSMSFASKPKELGSEAVEMIHTAARANAVELGQGAATTIFNDEYASLPKTAICTTGSEAKLVAKYLGYQIISTFKKRNTSDHVVLAIAREQIRNQLYSILPHNEDVFSVAHYGSTVQEVKTWYKHVGHDFYFHLKESKDVSRFTEQIIRMVANKTMGLKLPTFASKKGHSSVIRFNDVKEAFSYLEGISASGRKRFFTESSNRAYDIGVFEDCLYDMSKDEFKETFRRNGLTVAYGVIFVPDGLIRDEVANSEIYELEHYYPSVCDIQEVMDRIWPSVLLITPMFPLGDVAAAVDKALRWLLSSGWDHLISFLDKIGHAAHPWESVFGVGLDLLKLGPIMDQIVSNLTPILRKALRRTRVRFRGGFCNGYDHKYWEWRSWITENRMTTNEGWCIDSEIVGRAGEMYLIKFYRSSGSSNIVPSLSLPAERRVVMVADVESAWDRTTKSFADMRYFAVNEADWNQIFNWAMAEPLESINFAVMATTLNRIRGGLSLASNVLVQAMNIDDREVSKIALACMLETYRRKSVINMIEEDKDMAASYTRNVKKLALVLAKVGLSVATGGLAVPAFFLLKWLLDGRSDYEFVRYVEEPKFVTIKGKKKDEELVQKGFTVVVPHEQIKLQETCGCLLCDLQTGGAFSATGKPEDGQQFKATHMPHEPLEIGFTAGEMGPLVIKLRDAKNEHHEMGATGVEPHIRKLEHFFEAQQSGVQYKAKVHYVLGGPGTGKTEVIKALAMHFEDVGVSYEVMMPFKELSKDYVNATVLNRPGRHLISADTTWYVASKANKKVLIVDEMSNVDWDTIRCMAIYLNSVEIYLVGDVSQTCLNVSTGEGIYPFAPGSGLSLDQVPRHELVKNYRMGNWRVKLLNHLYGYRMISTRGDVDDIPEFLTRADYTKLKKTKPISRELCFAHTSCEQVFGVASAAGRDKDNHSVRSSQGKTYDVVAVTASEADRSNVQVHGMLNVAVSRAKGKTYFVTPESTDDNVVSEIRHTLYLHTEEAKEFIARQPWPEETQQLPSFRTVSDEEKFATSFFKKKIEENEMQRLASRDRQEPEFENVVSEEKTLVFHTAYSLDEVPWQFYVSQFHSCVPDAILKSGLVSKANICRLMGAIYNDDGLMGRKGLVGRFCSSTSFGGSPLPVVSEKRVLPYVPFLRLLERKHAVAVADGKGVLKYVTPAAERLGLPLKHFVCQDNHFQEAEAKLVWVKYDNMDNPCRVSALHSHRGKFVKKYPKSQFTVSYIFDDRRPLNDVPAKYQHGQWVSEKVMAHVLPPIGTKKVAACPGPDFGDLVLADEIKRVTGEDSWPLDGDPKFDTGNEEKDDYLTWMFYKARQNRLYNPDLESEAGSTLRSSSSSLASSSSSLRSSTDYTLRTESLSLDSDSSSDGYISEGSTLYSSSGASLASTEHSLGSVANYSLDSELASAASSIRSEPVRGINELEGSVSFHPDPRDYILSDSDLASILSTSDYSLAGLGTYDRVDKAGLEKIELDTYTSRAGFFSSWKKALKTERVQLKQHKLRLGTDAYKMASLVDPSVAHTRSTMLNDAAPARGPDEAVGMKIIWEGFLWDRTKAGKLRRPRDRLFRSFSAGFGNHYGDSGQEALIAASRYSSSRKKPRLNAETRRFAHKLASDLVRDHFRPDYIADPEKMNAVIERGIKDAKQRNYYKRGVLEAKKSLGKIVFPFSNKANFKPYKGGLDLAKGGQGIMQCPAFFNAEFICWSRIMNFQIKDRAADNYFLDDRETAADFRIRMTRAIRDMPIGAQIGIVDGRKFDSMQGPVTVEIEKQTMRLLGHHLRHIDDYYAIRGELPFRMFGKFGGKTDGAKGSGFFDTKSGNGLVMTATGTKAVVGIGPRITGSKGDDLSITQCALKEDEKARKLIEALTGISVVLSIGEGDEFLGNVVSRAGMYPSVVRACLKALGARPRDYKHFCEMQESYRNTLKEYQDCGLEEVIHFSALFEKKTANYVRACLEIYNSLAHINEKQWMDFTKARVADKFYLPAANGPRII